MLSVFKQVPAAWQQVLPPSLAEHAALQQLTQFLVTECATQVIYPQPTDWFKALELTPPAAVRVVILGQDPYHGAGQANGLAFSVSPQLPLPPSLRNIFKELAEDIPQSRAMQRTGDLSHWAEQGILLLNPVFTVRAGSAASHRGQGWEVLTQAIMDYLIRQLRPTVFILWGNDARRFAPQIQAPHLALCSAHPSPLSAYRGFWGSKPFSQTNAWLVAQQYRSIVW